MSRPLIPRPLSESEMSMQSSSASSQATNKPRKISTACGACKQRKTRCSGGAPCEACASRGSQCLYDATSDQRRKIANQRNMADLHEAQENLERHRQLLGGILATVRAGDSESRQDLMELIRSGMELSQLAAHVRNTRRTNPAIDHAYSLIDFSIDGGEELSSPVQLLSNVNSNGPN